MDTEEDMPRPNELQDGTMAEVNALRDLLSQIGDPDAAHDAGVIDDDEYVERKARKLAYTSALAAYAKDRDRGRIKAASVKEFLLGVSRQTLEAEAAAFAEAIWPRFMRPDALEVWNDWGRRGAHRVIVTASPTVA